jgi:hypothetical protein
LPRRGAPALGARHVVAGLPAKLFLQGLASGKLDETLESVS